MKMHEHLNMLGLKVRDKITGFTRVVSAVQFNLYGCIQGMVNPYADGKGTTSPAIWFDLSRLEIVSSKRVMDLPDFDYELGSEGD